MIEIVKINIELGRMRWHAHVADGSPLHTNEAIAAAAVAAYPTLPIHSCINSQGPTFGHVIGNTPIPHLLEHLVIAEQIAIVEERNLADATFVGNTQWIGEREAATEVSFVDDLVAVEALNRALNFLNSCLEHHEQRGQGPANCAAAGER